MVTSSRGRPRGLFPRLGCLVALVVACGCSQGGGGPSVVSSGGATSASGATTSGGGAAGGASTKGGSGALRGLSANPFGLVATTVTLQDAIDAYVDWKQRFLEVCPDGSVRVRYDDPAETVSEGIGYGMLLTAYHGDRGAFDGLWAFHQKNLNHNGLMNWKVRGCSVATTGQSSATDGELDCALALIVAARSWGHLTATYGAEARALIAKIKALQTTSGCPGALSLPVLKPGDVFGGCALTNPSYFSPAYYRVFAAFTGDSAWLDLAAGSYVLLSVNADPGTGLVSDWCSGSGAPGDGGAGYAFGGRRYHYDAARTPWRVALDFLWWGSAEAGSFTTRLTAWVNGVGVASIGDSYERDGTRLSANHNSTFVGPLACAAACVDQASLDAFAKDLKDIPSWADAQYFQSSMRALTLLTVAGGMRRA